ncbi:unnamed protein product [Pleuronectes platessa]|uniref:Uncharacterized protein n=1 Tax=Pleuronectes platessa TaxID=8262 RepID=A0A9N7Y5W1_PLEPL|nr:unnamed protein product [Pleuronectes platessa]
MGAIKETEMPRGETDMPSDEEEKQIEEDKREKRFDSVLLQQSGATGYTWILHVGSLTIEWFRPALCRVRPAESDSGYKCVRDLEDVVKWIHTGSNPSNHDIQ